MGMISRENNEQSKRLYRSTIEAIKSGKEANEIRDAYRGNQCGYCKEFDDKCSDCSLGQRIGVCNSGKSKWDDFMDYSYYLDCKEGEMLPHERKELLRLTTVIMGAILAEPEWNIYDEKGDKQ